MRAAGGRGVQRASLERLEHPVAAPRLLGGDRVPEGTRSAWSAWYDLAIAPETRWMPVVGEAHSQPPANRWPMPLFGPPTMRSSGNPMTPDGPPRATYELRIRPETTWMLVVGDQ